MFSHTKSTGSLLRLAKLALSWNTPSSIEASPKNATETRSAPSILSASAEPTASGIELETIGTLLIMPLSGSVRCIDPPRPPMQPGALP